MGNVLSHVDSRSALPADDDKWLKMKASASKGQREQVLKGISRVRHRRLYRPGRVLVVRRIFQIHYLI